MQLEITVPESLNEITLEQYQKFLKIQTEALNEGDINQKTEEFLMVKLIEVFCNVRGDIVLKMRPSDIISINNILTDMLNTNPSHIMKFKMNGKQYGFIPNLEDISFGEYIDLDTFLSDWDNMHKAMAVLYRPIKQKLGDKYLIEDYDAGDGEHMKQMPLDAVLGSIVFFYDLGIALSKATLNSMEEEQENSLVQYLNSEASGVGISQYTHSLKEMLDGLKISLN